MQTPDWNKIAGADTAAQRLEAAQPGPRRAAHHAPTRQGFRGIATARQAHVRDVRLRRHGCGGQIMMLFPKSRAEWLGIREGHVSSTESAALFGLSPYMTAYELAVLKKNPSLGDFEENERMTWGKRLERAIAQGIAEDYGVKVRSISGYASLTDQKMGASFDYEIIGLKDVEPPSDTKAWECDQTLRELYKQFGPGVLEIKNVDGFIYKTDWVDDEAPGHIELQVQHQLHCIERNWAAIGVLVGGNKQVLITRMRDRDVGSRIEAKIGKFWKGIGGGHMPPVTLPEDAGIIRALYKYADPGSLKDYQKGMDEEGERLHQLAWQHDEATKLKSAAEAHTNRPARRS